MLDNNWRQLATTSLQFGKYFAKRCLQDRINITAGHLAYVSMLSLVPLLAVVFAIFAAFPMFTDLREQIEGLLFSNLLPTSGEVIQEHINNFVSNASQMTTVGVIFLFVVAIMLVSAIDNALNRIWRNYKPRRLTVSIAIYWMVLTLGPILIGGGLAITSYILSLTRFTDDYISGSHTVLLSLVPFALSVLTFLLLYMMIPNRVVKARFAIWGALLAASLFELCKSLFSLYLANFPSYQAIYGALATIPILIVWIYLSWNVVLLGAELTVSLEEFTQRQHSRLPQPDNSTESS
ncbi:virulence factor BrkB family protein [Idiomarina xiamenensis]